ncbi:MULTISPECIES: molybdenum cofactor guanylyltransferase MobA [unclassified Haematobacter]|uniref:molybdenum cofactor guanylyltransferase MobA n=1 Tax=unclassified Haematobacter TaxID=2640585 RepID=UPI0025B9CA83|nr:MULTISPECIES: molybdenum cofactor guanylyltransferase MobA [unclassified Haematobacter]
MVGTGLPAVILAGGLSRRMGGGDKALRRLGGGTLLSHVITRMGAQAFPLALNANGDAKRFDVDLPVLADSISDHPGPLAGILAGMEWAVAREADWIVTAACDTPFLPADLVARLRARQEETRAAVVLAASGYDGRPVAHPTFGLWSTALAPALHRDITEGTRRIRDVAERAGMVLAMFDRDPFFNVNTPEDLDEARQRLAECPV